jgi:hypothetical protein
VIAFEQYLTASAGAYHAMAQAFEARGIVSGAHEEEDGGGEGQSVKGPAEGFALKGRAFRRAASSAQAIRL